VARENRGRREAVLVALAALIGLLLSVVYLLRTDGLAPDSFSYLRGGVSLLEGEGYRALEGGEQTVFPPGYPALLGAAARATRDPVAAGRYVSVAASVASIPLVYLLGRLLFSGGAGVWAAFLLALCPLRLQSSVMVLSESVFLALALGGTLAWAASGSRPWAGLFAGLCLGAAYLTRPEGLAIFVVCALAAAATLATRARPRYSAGLGLATLVVGFAVLALPYVFYLRQHTGRWLVTGKVERNLAIASARMAKVPFPQLRQLDEDGTAIVYPATATTAKAHVHRMLMNGRQESQMLADVGGLFLFACLGLGLAALVQGPRSSLLARLSPLLIAGALLLMLSAFFVEYRMMLVPLALFIVVAAAAASVPETSARRGAPSFATVGSWLLALACVQLGVGSAMIINTRVGMPMEDIAPLVAAVEAERDAVGPVIGNYREPRALALATNRDCLDLPWEPLPRVLRYAAHHRASFLLLRGDDHPDLAALAREPVSTDQLRPLAHIEARNGEEVCPLQLYRIRVPAASE